MKKFLFLTILFFSSFFFSKNVFAATEFISIIDPGNATGTDYTSLSLWEAGVQTDLTAAATRVYAGTMSGTQMSDTVGTLYLCRTGSPIDYTGTLVHEAAGGTQILMESQAGTATPTSGDIWYPTADCSGTAFFTISDGGADPIAVAKCRTSSGAADTTAVTIDGWTTGSSNYIKIWTDPNEPYRHQGKWDDTKYRLNITASGYTYPISTKEEYTRIDGLQINISGSTANEGQGIIAQPPSNGDIQISNNIIKSSMAAGGLQVGIGAYYSSKIWNNVVYNFEDIGIQTSAYYAATSYIYNNTIIDIGSSGINNFNSDATVIAKNNIVQNCTSYGMRSLGSSSTYNVTDLSASDGAFGVTAATGTADSDVLNHLTDADVDFSAVKVGAIVKNTTATTYSYVTSVAIHDLTLNDDIFPAGTGNYNVYTNMYGNVTFEDESNDDFHLDSSDTVAKNKGDNLYADASLAVATDVDNNARPNSATTFDIGADENIAKIYRSVGPSATTALITGKGPAASQYQANHLTISGVTATFELPLPDNVGVGDAIQYDADGDSDIDATDGIAFIDKRFSSFQYRIKAASGAAPTAMAVPDIDWTIYRSYTALSDAEAGTDNASIDTDVDGFDTGNRDMVTNQETWNFACYANSTTADTANVSIAGWIGSAGNYLKIYTPTKSSEVGTSQRHQGIWDDNKYKIECASSGSCLEITDNNNNQFINIEGLQIKPNTSAQSFGIRLLYSTASGSNKVIIGNNIINGSDSTNTIGIADSDDTFDADIYNNIIYGTKYSWQGAMNFISDIACVKNIYNNTIVNADIGIRAATTSASIIIRAKNNIVQNPTVNGNYYGTFNSSSANNISEDATSPNSGGTDCGGHSCRSQAVTFADETNSDFHVAPNDTIAKNSGIPLNGDLYISFNTDIDSYGLSEDTNLTRPYNTTWDIGADEVITKIYRSVAPDDNGDNTIAALATGSTPNHLNISGSTATFDTALPDNIGVGDVLEYDDDNNGTIDASDSIAFITARTDSTHYTIKKVDGSVPQAPSAADEIHWNINRAYTSLSNAEAGTENLNIDSDLRAFEAGNRDIKANSEQLYFACYANGTTADTATLTISGWTTAPQNFIKVYTPYLTSEVGTSQRHNGEWDSNKHRIEVTNNTGINSYDLYSRIEGLQIYLTSNNSSNYSGIYSAGSAGGILDISDNIIKASVSGATGGNKFGIAVESRAAVYAWNNTVYDFNYTGAVGIRGRLGGTLYAYNNTVYGCSSGIVQSLGYVLAKSNIVKGSGDTNAYVGTFVSGTDYNATDGTDTTGQGSNSHTSHTFTFADETGDDFHLASADAGAKDLSADLSQDATYMKYVGVLTDIDGSGRSQTGFGTWDIGADEVATAIYRSNGPSATTYLDRGVDESGTDLTISGSTATFENAAPDNVGVGDAIQYDSDNNSTIDAIAFITARTSGTSFTVKSAAGGTPIATTAADQDWQTFRAYASLYGAEMGNENSGLDNAVENFDDWTSGGTIDADEVGKNLGTYNEQWNVACYTNGATADSTAATIDDWTTYPTNYIKIYTPTATTEVGTSQRHQGTWGTGYQRTSYLTLSDGYIRLDGLASKISSATVYYVIGTVGSGEIQISNTFGWISSGTTGHYVYRAANITGSNIVFKVWNSIGINDVEGGAFALNDSDVTAYFYNDTAINNVSSTTAAFYRGSGTGIIKNCIGYSKNGDSFFGTWNSVTYSASDDDTADDWSGDGNRIDQTFSFADTANYDFHLTSNDTGAKNYGYDLSTDTTIPISTDIDGHTRNTSLHTGAFDIGADEAATAVYFSVGQNTTTHETGSGTVSITSGVATFSVAQTSVYMGVGDAIVAGGNTYYITGKTDTSNWTVRTAAGAVPANIGATDVTSISHAFSALHTAIDSGHNEAGDASHLNTLDLWTNNFQLNIPCYYDSAADTTAVTIDGWTTGVPNYIKVYTPNNITTEANQSQRHNGKWDDGKYRMEISTENDVIAISDWNVRIDGLQVKTTTGAYNAPDGITVGKPVDLPGNAYISNNIVKNGYTSGIGRVGIYLGTAVTEPNYIWNNIVYDFSTANSAGISSAVDYGSHPSFIYNNTIYNSYYGIYTSNVRIKAVNNIVQNCTDGYNGTFASGSDYNISNIGSSDAPNATWTPGNSAITVSFLDSTNKDYHLALADTSARNVGANLSADTGFAFATDIDGNGRSLWDIGADEGSVEAEATVMASGGDYSTLALWEAGMQTDLTSAGTMVFSGTKTLTVSDNASVTLYRAAVSQGVTATVVHASTTQILLESISDPDYTMAASDVWQVDGSNYFTISTAGGNPAIAVAKIDGAWSAADTSTVPITGWTTGPTNYIKIYTTNAARHTGKWDTTKYRIETTGSNTVFNISENFVRIDGVQMLLNLTTNQYHYGINYSPDASNETQISNNIIRVSYDSSTHNYYGAGIMTNVTTSLNLKIWNNIIYDWTLLASTGITIFSGGNAYMHNNTIQNCKTGMNVTSGTQIAKNNIISDCTTPASGTFEAGTDYNITDIGAIGYTVTGGGNVNDKVNQAIVFVDESRDDFHLANSDASAKNAGTDLSADTNLAVTTDIDGSTRPTGAGVVDIGADEAATMIYYSVGQNTNNNETGAGNVTVDASARTATFTVAQTATNMGVGDVIDYDSDNKKCYITGKTSTTVWSCQSVTGGAPTAASGVTVNSIHHTFQYLVNAEDDSDDAGYLNTSNLVTGNYVLNIPCYYDSGADQTAVSIDGWTTGHANYIKVYTPNNTGTEVNQTQRHSGKWDDAKYKLEVTVASSGIVNVNEEYVKIDGIQIKFSNNAANSTTGIEPNTVNNRASAIFVSNCIIKTGTIVGGNVITGIGYGGSATSWNLYVWNNIIYNITGGSATNSGIYVQADSTYQKNAYVYNNTIVDCGAGLRSGSATAVIYAKNNIVKGSGDTNAYVGTFATGTDYNATDGTDNIGQGGNNLTGVAFTFANETADDFHLAAADTAVKNTGTDLSNDSYLAFYKDIDNDVRPAGLWDIGADEYWAAELGGTADGSGGSTGAPETADLSALTAPIARWKFDEGYGDTANDSVGTYDGTLQSGGSGGNATNTAMWDKGGKYNSAMEFDGTNDYVSVADNNNIDFGTSNFSLSAWVKRSSTGIHVFLAHSNGDLYTTGTGYELWFGADHKINGAIGAASNKYVVLTGTTAVSDTNWHHIILAVDRAVPASSKIYLDGDNDNATVTSTIGSSDSIANAVNLIFGSESDGDFDFPGLLDEVKIYNYALSAGQVKADYNGGMAMQMGSSGSISGTGLPTRAASGDYCVPGDTTSCAGPVAEWNMNEKVSGDAQTIYDTSGNGNNGTTENGANGTGMDCSAAGKYGTGCEFDGTDDYVSVSGDLIGTGSVTFSAWVNARSFGENSQGRIISNNHFILRSQNVAGGRFYFSSDNESNSAVSGTSSLLMNQWIFITVTRDGSGTANIYVNGALSGNPDQNSGTPASGTATHIGNASDGSRTFDGLIDQVKIYNYIRSAAQIAWEYNQGKPLMQYKMDETSGDDVHNAITNSYNGTRQNMEVGDWVAGKFGNALDFDGTNEYVSIGDTNLNINSVSFWIYADSATDDIIDLDGTHTVTISGGEIQANNFSSATVYVDGDEDATVATGAWHNVAIKTDTAFEASALNLGKIGSGYFDGKLDDVRIYNYPVTATQVKNIYNEGKAVRF